MAKPANIKQVANHAKVSVATVSRAFQNPEALSIDTLQKVRSSIAALDYVPNVQARNLRMARTKLIIALVPNIANPFFSEVIRGIERVAFSSGYSVLLGDTQFDAAREQAYYRFVTARQADGLITLLPHVPATFPTGTVPIVNACEYVSDPRISSVFINNVAGAKNAVEYLTLLGHRDIAFVRGIAGSPLVVDRENGYREALTDAGISVDEALIANGDYTAESGMRAAESLIARARRFTAVFCANDEMALGVIKALRIRGLRVPEDVSIVGFDDIHLARYFDPALTTVAQPMRQLGEEAAALLLGMLTGPAASARKTVLPTQLVVRDSTSRIR